MPFTPSKFTELSADQRSVLNAITEPMSYDKIAETVGLPNPRTIGVLRTLQDRRLVEKRLIGWRRTQAGETVAAKE